MPAPSAHHSAPWRAGTPPPLESTNFHAPKYILTSAENPYRRQPTACFFRTLARHQRGLGIPRGEGGEDAAAAAAAFTLPPSSQAVGARSCRLGGSVGDGVRRAACAAAAGRRRPAKGKRPPAQPLTPETEPDGGLGFPGQVARVRNPGTDSRRVQEEPTLARRRKPRCSPRSGGLQPPPAAPLLAPPPPPAPTRGWS